mgnify:CR=1 FL=1
MTTKAHWEKVYQTKAVDEVSWYRPHLDVSLTLIEHAAPDTGSAVIDVGGTLWAIDTASTNGTTLQGAKLRASAVKDGAVFRLASEFNVVFKAVS